MRLVASRIVFGLGILALPLGHGQTWLIAAAAFAAINGPLGDLSMLHLLQTCFPPYRLAQVYRMQMCVEFAGMFAAYLAAPALFDLVGTGPTIVAFGFASVVSGVAGLGFFAWRRTAASAA